MELQGYDRVVATLANLKDGTDKKIIRPALKVGGKIMLAEARKEAPVVTGTMRDELKQWSKKNR